MRICVLTPSYPVATETFIFEPVRWLRQAGNRVDVVRERRPPPQLDVPGDFPARTIRSVGTQLHRLAWLARAPLAALGLAGVLRDAPVGLSRTTLLARAGLPEVRRADCLLAHFGPTGLTWLEASALARRPLAVYFHGGFDLPGIPGRPDYGALFSSKATILTNSAYVRDWLVSAGARPERVSIVRLAASPELAESCASTDPASKRIVTIARFVEKKGLEDSLEAFALAQDVLANRWRYEIVGDGELRPRIAERAAATGLGPLVELPGFLRRSATFDALRRAAIFVLASKKAPGSKDPVEGTPISILEAATLGLPIVATRHAGIPEMLPAQAEREGFLVPEGDVRALAGALRRLALDAGLRREWGASCRAYARAHYSADAHVRSLVEALGRAKPSCLEGGSDGP